MGMVILRWIQHLNNINVGFTSVSPYPSRPYPWCWKERDMGMNGKTLIIPLNNHNSWCLFYFVSIFPILISCVLYFHPYTSFPFFVRIGLLFLMAVMSYDFSFINPLFTHHWLSVCLYLIGRQIYFRIKYLILIIYNRMIVAFTLSFWSG